MSSISLPKYFEYAGKLIAHTVIHAGFGLVGLSRVVVQYLIEDDIDKCLTYLSVEDIPDLDIRKKIKEVIFSLHKILQGYKTCSMHVYLGLLC
jgi:hypothetical protein